VQGSTTNTKTPSGHRKVNPPQEHRPNNTSLKIVENPVLVVISQNSEKREKIVENPVLVVISQNSEKQEK
jgi:hypothetical protein